MPKQITTLFVSEPAGVSYMLGRDQFEQIDDFHVKFDIIRDATLADIMIESSYPFGDQVDIASLDVRMIESVTAAIVDVYEKLETRNVEETILDLEFPSIDGELTVSDQWIKSILIERLNEPERFEKLVGNIVVVAR